MVKTPIIKHYDLIKIMKQEVGFQLQVLLTLTKDIAEKQLEEVCSENPLDQLKNTNNQEIVILLKNSNDEINIPNKIPYSIRDVTEFKEECSQLLEKGIIRNSTSPHSAPAFYVENNNEIKRGKRRMVINYKKNE